MDYATVARWWADTVKGTGVSLYIGMADYLAGSSDPKDPWYGTEAIEAQLELNDTLPQVAGEVHFRYKLIADNPALTALYQAAYAVEEPAPRPEPPARPYLNREGHEAYIEGNAGLFRPEASLSRAEAVTLLSRLSVDGDGNNLYPGQATAPFSDVDRSAWYASYVAFAWEYGVADGYLDGTFRPDAPVNRSELVKLIAAYFDWPEAERASAFSDVPAGHWAAAPIACAAEQGWISRLSGRLLPAGQPDLPG